MDDPKGFSTISMTTADVLRAVIITAACEQKVMSNEKFERTHYIILTLCVTVVGILGQPSYPDENSAALRT